jgi:protocatechuate 3,4-dioxygenase beta subunit
MDQRKRLLAIVTLAGLVALPGDSSAQTPRAASCRERPAAGAVVAIAGPDEPGERLAIVGRVVAGPDRQPVAGARVYAFHTDAAGYYSDGGMDESDPRLCGAALSAADGDYRFDTIRPAHYATGGPPAHVHFEVTLPDGRHDSFTLNFAGDPLLRGRGAGATWETVRPIEPDADGGGRVTRDLWVP